MKTIIIIALLLIAVTGFSQKPTEVVYPTNMSSTGDSCRRSHASIVMRQPSQEVICKTLCDLLKSFAGTTIIVIYADSNGATLSRQIADSLIRRNNP